MSSVRLVKLKNFQKTFCRMASADCKKGVVSLDEGKRFIVDCMKAVKTPEEHAEQLADLLIAADYRGHFSHGMNRLEMYCKDVSSGICDANAKPVILKESSATAWVDGKNGLGPVIGNFCMDLAIKKAKETGVGWVVAKGSNHYGIAGFWSMKALEHNLIGMSVTNTSPFLCPTRAKDAALGTNPLSVAAPAKDNDSFVLDMATTAVAVGKIEVQMRKNEPIPEGWAVDKNGKPTTDAAVGFESRRLMPLGGAENTSGYKGYGLATMVEVFSGMLAGSMYGPNVRQWLKTDRVANLGQGFFAINPECFAPGFEGRMSDLMGFLRNMEPVDHDNPVLVAGDPERAHMAKVDSDGGISYHENQLKSCVELANNLKVPQLKVL